MKISSLLDLQIINYIQFCEGQLKRCFECVSGYQVTLNFFHIFRLGCVSCGIQIYISNEK